MRLNSNFPPPPIFPYHLPAMSQQKKLILVIGATGAQGLAVIDALLAPAVDGSPSPYAIRALTRDPESRRAKSLAEKGVELFKGILLIFLSRIDGADT